MRMTPTYHGYSPFTALTGANFSNPIPVSDSDNMDIKTIVQKLKQIDVSLMSNSTSSTKQKSFTDKIPPELHKCSHVWLRVDRVRKPLEAPFTGPHKVLQRNISQSTMSIDINGQEKAVSINRLKPCNQSKEIAKEILFPSPPYREMPILPQPRVTNTSDYETGTPQSSPRTASPDRTFSLTENVNETATNINTTLPIEHTPPNENNPQTITTNHLKIPQVFREALYGKQFQKLPELAKQFNIDIDVTHIGRNHDLVSFQGPNENVKVYDSFAREEINRIANSREHPYNTRSKSVHFQN